MILAALAACAALGCGARKRQSRCNDRPCLEEARDNELGRGRPRDYVAAASAYERECSDGSGNAVACRKLAWSLFAARGIAYDRLRGSRLLAIACKRGDAVACGLGAISGAISDANPTAILEQLHDACADENADACVVEHGMQDLGAGDCGETCEQERTELARRGCRLGAADLCAAAASSILRGTCRREDAADACAAKLEAAATKAEAPISDAYRRLVAACDNGDADACDAIPGRSIPASELCMAGDFTACSAAAESGDAAAGRRGCEEGNLPSACLHAGIALRDGEADRNSDARRFLDRACAAGETEACDALRNPDLATGCAVHKVRRSSVTSAKRLDPFEGRELDGTPRMVPSSTGTPTVLLHGDDVQPNLLAETVRIAKDANVVVLVSQAAPRIDGATVMIVNFGLRPVPAEIVVLDAAGLIRASGHLGWNRANLASRSLPRCIAALLAEL